MINRWSAPCVKQKTLLLLTNNDENATCGDSPEDIKNSALGFGSWRIFGAAPQCAGGRGQ